MAFYVNNDDSFEVTQPVTRECPHCGAHAQLMPLATPRFDVLNDTRPQQTGIVFRCAACDEPRFVRATVRAFEPERVVLSSNLHEVERAKERFQFSYLPPNVERLFHEGLECYAAGCHNAFASMCRRTLQASHADLGRNSRRRWHELYKDVVAIGEVDEPTTQAMEAVLFGVDGSPPEVGPAEAAVLIEVIKDMLYQLYVRTAKLRAAVRMRRYFAGESARKITPLQRHSRRVESA